MRTQISTALLALILSICSTSAASSRNGYRLVFVDLSTTKSSETSIHLVSYFNSELPPDTYRCAKGNHLIEIDLIYASIRPKTITNDLIERSLRAEKAPLKILRKALRTYRDSEINKGFDGLVVFKNESTHYELTTIGSTDIGYERSFKVNAQQKFDTKTLKALFCGSLANLPYAYTD